MDRDWDDIISCAVYGALVWFIFFFIFAIGYGAGSATSDEEKRIISQEFNVGGN